MWLAAVEAAKTIGAMPIEELEVKAEYLLSRAAIREQAREERERRTRKALREGYAPRDEQFYSVGVLRRLIPAWLDGGVTDSPPRGREAAGGRSKGSEYGDWLVGMVDLDTAMSQVRVYHRDILERYFAYPQGRSGWTHEEISGALGINPETLRKRVYRALRAVQQELGGNSPW